MHSVGIHSKAGIFISFSACKNKRSRLVIIPVIAVTALCFNGCRSAEDLFTHTIMSTISSPEGTSGTASSPNGATITAWDDGKTIGSAVVANNAYKTPDHEIAMSDDEIDSARITSNGYRTLIIKNIPITTGGQQLEFNLEQAAYQHSLTITLISSEAGEGHLVRDSPIILTNSQGTRTLNTSGQTITYSWTSTQATENITYDINVSGSGHQDVPAKAVSIGTALTENRTLTANDWAGDITYNIKDQDSQNVSGALVSTSQSKSGTTNTSGNVTLLNYIITENTYSEPLTTNINHTVSKTGYTTKNGSANINTGTNNVQETIEEIATNNYNENIIFANQTADEYDNGLVFIIKTLNDGQEHTYNVTNTQQIQNITLNGDYDTNTQIQLYYTNTSAAAQGKEAKILTVVRSKKQPTASNGSRNTTLTTTINDLFTPNTTGDTAWILSLETDMYNNEAFRTHVNGGKEWVHSAGGNRTMNIRGIMRSYHNDGTYADDLTAAEIQAIRERAALFDQDFWTRGTGLVILNVNYTEPTSRSATPGVEILYWRDEPQPLNGHYQINTTRPNTYDYGIGHVPYGTVMYLGQFAEEATQAVDWIFDYNGQCGDIVDTDDNGNNPYFKRQDDLIVNMTYVGGKAPKNE